MQRQFNKLQQSFDLLVIGGGIAGAWTAYDAARRGLTVALIEKTDWAAGTSSASSKMIHGGLRYLENFEFSLVRGSLEERRRLSRLAPHQVAPLRFLIPIYDDDRVGKLRFRMGLTLYDGLAGRGQPVAKHNALKPAAIVEQYPHLRRKNLVGGFTYGDCQEDDARFTLEVVSGALFAGAVCVNHCRAIKLLHADDEPERVIGAEVRDEISGQTLQVHADCVVNAAGPWSQEMLGPDAKQLIRKVKGVHIVMPPLPGNDGMLITSRSDGRVIFLIPWFGQTLLGTTDSDFEGPADSLAVESEDIRYLLDAANHNFEGFSWTEADVRGGFAGLRTLKVAEGKSATEASRDWTLERPMPGLLMPTGGKFTTAREDAALIVDAVSELLNLPSKECTTDRRPLPWSPLGAFENWFEQAQSQGQKAGLDELTAYYAARRHGRMLEHLLRILAAEPELSARIDPLAPFCWAEIVNSARREMVSSLDDILRRRAPVAVLCRLTDQQIQRAAALAGRELNWDRERQDAEIVNFSTLHRKMFKQM